NNNIKPEHLDDTFLAVLRRVTEERLAAKKAGQSTKAEALKITINSIFGKLASDTMWLLDYKAFLSVTLNGQLYLLMLVEMLHKAGIHCISANTDGVVARVHERDNATYQAVCDEWMARTRCAL